ncbi:endolytic transglycosylase MltG [Pseudoclavibacter sp. 13-3]|uniref:endolytic transglycosylase MltG n=1 Tax=Pseudoclavibacter sp. 13-3 TaxID=2901228 RepID=UPI001E4A8970|nr:endolytic transglycosylase MltG [Pseudoclavibacter sp. 13-3]MCD7102011.1 endolytic transglycosylase MltG [Pseudoclavibacter sp. 13-3]
MSRHAGRRRTRRKRTITWIVVTVLVVVFISALLFAGRSLMREMGIGEVIDYPGPGTDDVTFVIRDGESGTDIAENLVDVGVIKTYKGFLDEYHKRSPEPVFQPGAYKLQKESPSSAVIDVLSDPSNRVDLKVVIPEGYRQSQILARISDVVDLPLEKLQAAAHDVNAYDVPQQAKDHQSLEGFLFPATYTIDPEAEPKDIIKQMVDRANTALDNAGVQGDAARYEVMTKASVVQAESGSTADMGKVARVIDNRLDQSMPLQMDSTVTYGSGRTDIVEPDKQERDDASNKYNTYANKGLPVGPIGNPGDDAIQASINPTPGDWLYFVTVNLDTGETVFSTTLQEHQAAVDRYNAWKQQKGIQ